MPLSQDDIQESSVISCHTLALSSMMTMLCGAHHPLSDLIARVSWMDVPAVSVQGLL